MKNILDIEVSCFKNYFTPDNPKNVNLLTWLTSDKYKNVVLQIRSFSDKKTKDNLKANLPAITPSGLFKVRNEQNLIKHSGLLQFDIDYTGENTKIGNFLDLKNQICNIKNVVYCGKSVSGTGYWGLIPVATPENHKEHFNALYIAFKNLGLELDEKPKNISSLRGYSYDPEQYINLDADYFYNTIGEESFKVLKQKTPKKHHFVLKPQIHKTIVNHRFTNKNNKTPSDILIKMIQNATDGSKHLTLLNASILAGGFIANGSLDENTAVNLLENCIRQHNIKSINQAKNTIFDGVNYGKQKPLPLYNTGKPINNTIKTIQNDTSIIPHNEYVSKLRVENGLLMTDGYPALWDTTDGVAYIEKNTKNYIVKLCSLL